MPEESAHLRVDTGVRRGDGITLYYDPLIAKLVVWDTDRGSALRRLRHALTEFQVAGVDTNLQFLSAIAVHPAFEGADLDTGLIPRHRTELLGGGTRLGRHPGGGMSRRVDAHRRRGATGGGPLPIPGRPGTGATAGA